MATPSTLLLIAALVISDDGAAQAMGKTQIDFCGHWTGQFAGLPVVLTDGEWWAMQGLAGPQTVERCSITADSAGRVRLLLGGHELRGKVMRDGEGVFVGFAWPATTFSPWDCFGCILRPAKRDK